MSLFSRLKAFFTSGRTVRFITTLLIEAGTAFYTYRKDGQLTPEELEQTARLLATVTGPFDPNGEEWTYEKALDITEKLAYIFFAVKGLFHPKG